MTGSLAWWLVVATAAATVVLLVVIGLAHAVARARRRRQVRTREAVAPLLLDITDGADVPTPTRRREARMLAEAAAALVHKVRGADRDALAAWLEAHGFRDEALAGLRARSAVRRAASIELALAIDDDPAPVLPLVADPHPQVRATAVRMLGAAGHASAIPTIVGAAVSPRRGVSMSVAAMSLVQVGPTSAEAFGAVWTSADPRARRLAVEVTGRLGLADGRRRVEHELGSDDPRLRRSAAEALARIGSPLSTTALEAALARAVPGTEEQRAVREALVTLQEDA